VADVRPGELEFPPPFPRKRIKGWRYHAETGGSASARERVCGAQSLQAEMIALWLSLVERDVFGKPASTFLNRALTAGWAA
jgi:hypothetical protein